MTIEDQQVIGERIRKILDERGLTAKEIAEKISITPQNFSNYLTGKRSITDKFLVKASQAIGISFASLRFGNELKQYDESAPVDLVDMESSLPRVQPMSTVKERLQFILDKKDVTPYQIAKNTPVSESTLSRILSGESIPRRTTIAPICKYLGVSDEWLLTGKGEAPNYNLPLSKVHNEAIPIELIDEDDVSKNARGTEFRELDNGMLLMTIPLVPEYAYAGYLNGWKDAEFIEELPKHSIVVDKRHSGKYRAFVVRGDSMDNDRKDAISVGDIVTGRNVDKKLWESKLHFHKYPDFVIVHQDGIVIKRIVRHDVENGIIDCTSLNEDKKFYPDFSIKLSEVYELYNIVKQEKQRGI